MGAQGVAYWQTKWPDIAVGGIIAVMFLHSAVSVLREAIPEVRSTKGRS